MARMPALPGAGLGAPVYAWRGAVTGEAGARHPVTAAGAPQAGGAVDHVLRTEQPLNLPF